MQMIRRKTSAQIRRECETKIARACKRVTLFRIPGEGKPGEWRTITSLYSEKVAAYLRKMYPTVVIANEGLSDADIAWMTNEKGVD
jgi:hypothetical protein